MCIRDSVDTVDMLYSFSSDNGVSWATPKIIGKEGAAMIFFTMAGSHTADIDALAVTSLPPQNHSIVCLLYTSPSPRDLSTSRMPSSA
eukprot:TRINITY_DN11033_c0_g1_i1.p2 TRINITY_DN11033_c0_g1~~TRINITY_DN11033_c0_g1_i1.p2  ORF type:complete len:101 (+),score=43.93 TRINITY_DN11033_c0_g1_i1:42-305(+)